MFPFLKSLAAVADNRTRYSVEVVGIAACRRRAGRQEAFRWLTVPSLFPQRLFMVPASEAQAHIPYARVNHNKYMVTEKAAYIGERGAGGGAAVPVAAGCWCRWLGRGFWGGR